ncbi:hypothetical protein E4P40_26365 [Blastococcus sp. CT_GayMR20]|uniref:hypothetical protein n=1 Tax=Blastococcus sp. CT_GayMR20 TaxID=2559609 RepID=UPI00107312DC|nr:hypothetical protein [Blastococcus sp. CT_GayMR20]TFV65494.1 hypothetical protein E4P40_26365 [Blastococcus sp. CT_GayMR20]
MNRRRARLSAALVGLPFALVVSGCTGTDAEPPAASSTSSSPGSAPPSATTNAAPESQRIEVTVAGGAVTGDTGRVPVAAGTPVTLAITSDVADEVHVHGYELTADLAPGQPASITFEATIPGVFEVELHEAGTVLLSLQVQ